MGLLSLFAVETLLHNGKSSQNNRLCAIWARNGKRTQIVKCHLDRNLETKTQEVC